MTAATVTAAEVAAASATAVPVPDFVPRDATPAAEIRLGVSF
jgi:hypothetical protein